jgi:hypothetical protein
MAGGHGVVGRHHECGRTWSSRDWRTWRRQRQIRGGWQSGSLALSPTPGRELHGAKVPRLLVDISTVLSVIARGW